MNGFYRVTKKINGHLYDYWQRTKRIGKSMKTENVYIGPARTTTASAGSSVSVTAPQTPEDVRRFDTSTGVTPQMQHFLDGQRREDERIQYGPLAARIRREKAELRAVKRKTKGTKALNLFIGQGIKK